MKIFVFSTVFAPSIGGIEQLCQTLCAEWVAMGHDVRLATLTPGDGEFPYPVLRNPSFSQMMTLMRWCDVHLQTAVSLRHIWPRILFPAKTVFQHPTAYVRDDGSRKPADHLKAFIAARSCGIANSHYTARQTGASHTVFNAYDDALFKATTPWSDRKGDVVFLGRLVSQKGCDTVIEALRHLRAGGITPQLTIIGEGPEEPALRQQCEQLHLGDQVRFIGKLQGAALVKELNQHRILVAPSRYREPFGIVALEGLGCGCLPIVSKDGGLVDAIGEHGLVFANGDSEALAQQLGRALTDPSLVSALMENREDHLLAFKARHVAEKYLAIFQKLKEAA